MRAIALCLGVVAGIAGAFIVSQLLGASGGVAQQEGGTRITSDNLSALVQAGSSSVTRPHFVEWNRKGDSLYIAMPEALSEYKVAEDQLQQLASISPKDMLLSLSSNGLLALLRNFESVVVTDGHSGEQRAIITPDTAVSSARFSPDGSILALVLDDGSMLQTWDTETGALLGEYHSKELEDAYSVDFAPSGRSLVWFSPTAGQALDLETDSFGPTMTFPDTVVALEFGPDERLLIASADHALTLVDTTSADPVDARMEIVANSLSVSPDGRLLLITTQDGVATLDLSSLEELHSLPGPAFDAKFSPSGESLVVVGADGTMSVWQPG